MPKWREWTNEAGWKVAYMNWNFEWYRVCLYHNGYIKVDQRFDSLWRAEETARALVALGNCKEVPSAA